MRWVTLILILVVIALQYPLWFGRGGWLRVREVDNQITQQQEINARLEQRNAGLDAEVRDLKQGYEAIEERARYELGMVKPGEVLVQLLPNRQTAPPVSSNAEAPPAETSTAPQPGSTPQQNAR